MGVSINGLHGQTTGKVGNLVYYTRKGKNIVRTIGVNLNPPSIPQRINRQGMTLISQLMSTALPFVRLGYSTQIGDQDTSAYNLALGYNKINALQFSDTAVNIDYTKLRFSEGNLMQAEAAAASLVPEGVRFGWSCSLQTSWPDSGDQVMMLAYFPRSGAIAYKLFGRSRVSETDVLVLEEELKDQYMETYISFVSEDRTQLATSTYTGALNL